MGYTEQLYYAEEITRRLFKVANEEEGILCGIIPNEKICSSCSSKNTCNSSATIIDIEHHTVTSKER